MEHQSAVLKPSYSSYSSAVDRTPSIHRSITIAVPANFPPLEDPVDYRVPMHFTDISSVRFINRKEMADFIKTASESLRREFMAKFDADSREAETFWAAVDYRFLIQSGSNSWSTNTSMEESLPAATLARSTLAIRPTTASRSDADDVSNSLSLPSSDENIRPTPAAGVPSTASSASSASSTSRSSPGIFAVRGPPSISIYWPDIHPTLLSLIRKHFPWETAPVIRYFCHERPSALARLSASVTPVQTPITEGDGYENMFLERALGRRYAPTPTLETEGTSSRSKRGENGKESASGNGNMERVSGGRSQ